MIMMRAVKCQSRTEGSALEDTADMTGLYCSKGAAEALSLRFGAEPYPLFIAQRLRRSHARCACCRIQCGHYAHDHRCCRDPEPIDESRLKRHVRNGINLLIQLHQVIPVREVA